LCTWPVLAHATSCKCTAYPAEGRQPPPTIAERACPPRHVVVTSCSRVMHCIGQQAQHPRARLSGPTIRIGGGWLRPLGGICSRICCTSRAKSVYMLFLNATVMQHRTHHHRMIYMYICTSIHTHTHTHTHTPRGKRKGEGEGGRRGGREKNHTEHLAAGYRRVGCLDGLHSSSRYQT